MKLFLLALSLFVPLFLWVFAGKYLNVSYSEMRRVFGIVFLGLSGFFIKHQRYMLALVFFLLSLVLTSSG